jgi:putative aldouronate transport system permease protein
MLLPALVGLALFSYYPMYGIIIAFQNYKPLLGIGRSAFVGLANFERMLTLPDTWVIFQNTVLIAIGKIVLGQLAAVVLALLLNEVVARWFKRLIQTLTYVLHFLSWVIFGGILLDILLSDGLVNGLLGALGLPSVQFLTEPRIFPATLILTHVWKEFGFSAIIYLAALTAVNPNLYEAAAVDGANRWQQIRHITIPGISSIIVLMACLSLGNVLNAGFEQILILQNPQVLSSGEIIDTFVYKAGLRQFQYSLATAVGLLKGIVSLVLIALSYYLADRLANYRIF